MELVELVRAVKKAKPVAGDVSPAEARRIRERARMSRERCGAAIGVSARTIQRWEAEAGAGGNTPGVLAGQEYRKLLGLLYDLAGEPRPQAAA